MGKYEFTLEERRIYESIPLPFAMYQFIDERVVTILVSDSMCALMNKDRPALIKQLDDDMYNTAHPDDMARVADAAYRFAAEDDGTYDVVYRVLHSGGGYGIVHAKGESVTMTDGTILKAVWYMYEGEYQENRQVRGNSLNHDLQDYLRGESLIRDNYFDSLTGLPNMAYFFQLAEAGRRRIVENGGVPTVLFFDLVGMKYFNSKYGFEEGDRLLSALAGVLKKHFRNENCGRFGRDHFAVYTGVKNVEEELETIFRELEDVNGDRNLPVHVGVYRDCFEKVSVSMACDRAKIACDVDYNNFVSRYVFYDEKLRKTSLLRNHIISHFDEAIQEGWIKVYYQPVVRSTNGMVCGEEALSRWVDPEMGRISPAEFIPILEGVKLIYKLDLYVVDQIIKDFRVKEEAGLDMVPVSINLSRYDFHYTDIVGEISRKMDEAGLPHNMLNIEITESVFGEDFDFLKSEFRRFHDSGFQVWMDDFGSGYSSLNALQSFDFDLIKFDMKFMRELNANEKNPIIIGQLMQMAIKLGVDTIAEGVETEEHIKFLNSIGCDKQQGYYYSEAVSTYQIVKKAKEEKVIPHESMQQRPYYEAISKAVLNEDVMQEIQNPNLHEHFSSIPMGVVECVNGEFHVLRYNDSYAQFLVDMKLVGRGQFKNNLIRMNHNPSNEFQKAVEKAIGDGQWTSVDNGAEREKQVQSFVKLLKKNPLTDAYALQVVVVPIS